MTHFGILCPPATGHLNTMLPLGKELLLRGHQVTVFGFLDAQAKTLASGLEFQPLAEDEFPLGAIANIITEMGKLSGLAALRYNINQATRTSEAILREAPTAIKKAGVEALLIDQVALEGGTVADVLNLPFITICSALILNRDPMIPPIFTTWAYNPTWTGRLRNQLAYQLLTLTTKPIRELLVEYRRKWNLPVYSSTHDYYSKSAGCWLI